MSVLAMGLAMFMSPNAIQTSNHWLADAASLQSSFKHQAFFPNPPFPGPGCEFVCYVVNGVLICRLKDAKIPC